MLQRIVGVLGRPLASDSRDASVGSILLYVAGVLLFILSTRKIASLQLTEAQLVLGLLVAICVTMQIVIMGMLLDVRARLQARDVDRL